MFFVAMATSEVVLYDVCAFVCIEAYNIYTFYKFNLICSSRKFASIQGLNYSNHFFFNYCKFVVSPPDTPYHVIYFNEF